MCVDRSRLPSQEMLAKYVHAVTCQPADNPGETPHDIVAEAIELELSQAQAQAAYQYGAVWPSAACVMTPLNASMAKRPFFSSASRRAGVSSLSGSSP